jgi:hypothetical protein
MVFVTDVSSNSDGCKDDPDDRKDGLKVGLPLKRDAMEDSPDFEVGLLLNGSSVGIGLGFGDGSSMSFDVGFSTCDFDGSLVDLFMGPSVGVAIAVGDSLGLDIGFGEGSSVGDVVGW